MKRILSSIAAVIVAVSFVSCLCCCGHSAQTVDENLNDTIVPIESVIDTIDLYEDTVCVDTDTMEF